MTVDSRVSGRGVLARAHGSLGVPSLFTISHKEDRGGKTSFMPVGSRDEDNLNSKFPLLCAVFLITSFG